jgi:DNA (cytosine-5)-methyltransferase 1
MPRVLDLFCGAGGAGAGYARAGCDVTGVDIVPQPRYPFHFVLADALEYVEAHGHEYDLIHASPPCQAHMRLRHWTKKEYPDLVAATRAALIATRRPYVIENVPDAPLENPLMLCGSMFGLRVMRHRLFETQPAIWWPPGRCSHPKGAVGRRGNEGTREWITVTGHFSGVPKAQQAMGGLTWMTQHDLAQAIPPAYTEWIAGEIRKMEL